MSLDEIGNIGEEELGNYVPVTYGRSGDEADWYCQLLVDHDIPARVDEDYEGPPPDSARTGVPVLVPESMLEEAHEVIAEVDEMEVFPGDEDETEDEDDDDDLDPGFHAEDDAEEDL